jgi:hypothetical protein
MNESPLFLCILHAGTSQAKQKHNLEFKKKFAMT